MIDSTQIIQIILKNFEENIGNKITKAIAHGICLDVDAYIKQEQTREEQQKEQATQNPPQDKSDNGDDSW